MIMMVEGGMMGPRQPPASTGPVANALSYPRSSMAGRAIRPIMMVAVAATPLMAAMTAVVATVAMARPPLTPPIHLWKNS